MTVKIPLRLRGLDLRQVEAYDRIHPELAELSWEGNGGLSLAVIYGDDPAYVAAEGAGDSARLIAKLMPGVTVADVHDELVSVSDIAARSGVTAEAVRLWTVGKRHGALAPFPSPRQVVGSGSGGKSMSLYAWREVVTWIREIIGTDPDEGIEYLTDAQIADLNAELAAIPATLAWRPMSVDTEWVIANVQRLCEIEVAVAHRAQTKGTPAEHALKLRFAPPVTGR